jgi:hypothetical protein
MAYFAFIDHQVCSVILVIEALKKGELRVRHA